MINISRGDRHMATATGVTGPGTELAGKVALITGAARNIGRATALALAAGGAAVAINTRASREDAEKVVQDIRAAGGQAEVYVADIANAGAVKTMAAFPGKPQIWAVGERVRARLADAGLQPVGLYAVAALRVGIGLVLMLAARTSRTPKILCAFGAVVLVAGLATPLFGVERARAIFDWEATQGNALIRVGAGLVLAIGGFIAFAVAAGRRPA
jgi:NAD(P)-dependent dehydrogenase (short-subunit alcohol dehydrogenase family)